MSAILRALGLFMMLGGHVMLGGAMAWWLEARHRRRQAATDEAAKGGE